jgi:hypothetical protein
MCWRDALLQQSRHDKHTVTEAIRYPVTICAWRDGIAGAERAGGFVRHGKIDRPPDPNPRIPAGVRRNASRKRCEACRALYGKIAKIRGHYRYATENLDHIFPRRFLIQFGLKPHLTVNLISVCGPCHGVKKRSENRLFMGDAIGYVIEVIKAGWPARRVYRAACYYAFKEVAVLINRRYLCPRTDRQSVSDSSPSSSPRKVIPLRSPR